MKKVTPYVSLKKIDSSSLAVDITAGNNMAILDQSSYIWCWGVATSDLNITTVNQSSPVAAIGDRQFIKFVNGMAGCIAALDASSYAWVFGDNTSGLLGNNRQGASYGIPQSVVGNKQWLSLSSGSGFFSGLDSSSYAWAWGSNSSGYIGDNTATNKSSPTSVVGGKQFTKLVVGSGIACALDASSYAWSWGGNSGGAIGDNTNASRSSPVSVVGGIQFTNIQAGRNDYVLAIDGSSYVWAWGDNTYGQYGNSTQTNSSSPTSVLANEWNKLSLCGYTIFGLNKNNKQYTWGDNTYGQYGNNSNISRSAPTINQFPFTLNKICGGLSGGTSSVLALDTSSNVWTWGSNTNGMLGTGNVLNSYIPTKPLLYQMGYSFWKPPLFMQIAMSSSNTNNEYMTVFLDQSANAWYWGGLIQNSLFGTTTQYGPRSPSLIPTGNFISTSLKFIKLRLGYCTSSDSAPVVGIDLSSYAWTWCTNTYGQAGTNSNSPFTQGRSWPHSVVGGKQWIKILPSYDICYGMDTSSYLWSWGANATYGSLGDNTNTNRSSPVSVVGGRQILKLAATNGSLVSSSDLSGSCCFLDSSSYAWAFGYGVQGTLGNNLNVSNSSPVSVVGNKQFINIGSSHASFYGLDSSSYLWAWGYNNFGQLGDNTVTLRSSPVSVVGGRRFIYLPDNNFSQCMAALDSSSYAWTWGGNTGGILGDGTATNKSSPVSVINGYQWVEISPINNDNLFGVRSYPNSEFVICGPNNAYGNNFGFYMSATVTFSAPVLATNHHNYLTSPVLTYNRKNILGK